MSNFVYKNPVIPGFNPDPSICRVGGDFYLVTSTFEFFPGVPVYHSKNLVNWEMIGHCLTRDSQLPLGGCPASGGIFAPTLRHHDGIFYMTTTNVSHKGNFIVHTHDIQGEWSEPVWIDQKGIDPSLLFEDDKVYFCSNGGMNGEPGIYMCELNPVSGEIYTESRLISNGCGGRYPEAPHVYKWNGRYYLMLAEGGTEYGHMVTIQRSKSPYGPYEPCPHNPILSHRDNTGALDIECTGHADIIEDNLGNWWMVSLGVRPLSPNGNKVLLHNLGRETFLSPLHWDEQGWPQVGNNGKISIAMQAKLPEPVRENKIDVLYDFTGESLNREFTYIRNPDKPRYHIDNTESCLVMDGGDVSLSEDGKSPTFAGVRQKDFEVEAAVHVRLCECADRGQAGISVYYNHEHHCEILISQSGRQNYICLNRRIYDLEVTISRVPVQSDAVYLKIISGHDYYSFYYSFDGQAYVLLDRASSMAFCSEITRKMTFTGTFLGLYAVSAKAKFSCFSVKTINL